MSNSSSTARRNLLSDEQIRSLLDDYEARMQRGREAWERRPDVRTRPAFYMDEAAIRRMSVACRIALGEDPVTLRPLLSEAVERYVIFFRMRNLWQEEERRSRGEKVDVSLFAADRMFAATTDAITLNEKDRVQEMAALDPAVYSGWHPPKFGTYHSLLKALFAYALGDHERGAEAASDFLNNPAFASVPEALIGKLRPQAEAIVALSRNEAGGFSAALDRLLAVHAQHAKEGSGATNPGTLVCFEGLALVALARRQGLMNAPDNVYLPLGLIA